MLVDPRMTSNEFNENSAWGYKANEDLKHTRGKDFRHAKTKKKRGSYTGGNLDVYGVNSVKFNYDD